MKLLIPIQMMSRSHSQELQARLNSSESSLDIMAEGGIRGGRWRQGGLRWGGQGGLMHIGLRHGGIQSSRGLHRIMHIRGNEQGGLRGSIRGEHRDHDGRNADRGVSRTTTTPTQLGSGGDDGRTPLAGRGRCGR
jgi:hypothetical protein